MRPASTGKPSVTCGSSNASACCPCRPTRPSASWAPCSRSSSPPRDFESPRAFCQSVGHRMDTLLREDTTAPAPDAAAPAEAPAVAEPATRACGSCGAAMIDGQDWCLECGPAAPGRLGRRPGMRAALTVAALTVVLVCGAVTAGYAALSGDAGRDAVAAAGPD